MIDLRTKTAAIAIALAAIGLGSACHSAPRTLNDAYRITLETAREHGGFHSLSEGEATALAEARAKVVEIEARDGIETPSQAIAAAFVLCSSHDQAELGLAHELALMAAESGDPRGRPLAAEALDRALVLRGEPQRFGTQIGFEPVLGGFRLLPVDPRTSDAEREAFGVPSLEELRRIAERLNEP